MEVLEHDENRSRRCRFEESKPEIVQETEVLDLRCRRVQQLLHPAGMRLVFDIVDPRQKDPNRGHRGCQRDPGLDVQALSPSGRKTKLSGPLLHVGDQRRLADPGVPGNQHDLRLSLAGEPRASCNGGPRPHDQRSERLFVRPWSPPAPHCLASSPGGHASMYRGACGEAERGDAAGCGCEVRVASLQRDAEAWAAHGEKSRVSLVGPAAVD